MNKNHYAYELLLYAKNNDRQKQKELLNLLIDESLSIRYQYLSRAKNCGMSLIDLKDLVTNSLFVIFAKNIKEIDKETFLNFFRYIYMRNIQQELRQRYKTKSINITDYEVRSSNYGNHSSKSLVFSSNESFSNNIFKNYDSVLNDEICQKLIYDNACNLTKSERNIMISYLKGFNLIEQAKIMNLKPSTMYTHFRNSIQKLRNFIDVLN